MRRLVSFSSFTWLLVSLAVVHVFYFQDRRGFDLRENLQAAQLSVHRTTTHTGLVVDDRLCLPELVADLVENAAKF